MTQSKLDDPAELMEKAYRLYAVSNVPEGLAECTRRLKTTRPVDTELLTSVSA